MLKFLSSMRLFFAVCLALGAVFLYQTVFNRGAPVYGSAWFAALGTLAAVNISACSLGRLKTAPPHSLLLHSGLVLIILGAFAAGLFRFKGDLPLHKGKTSGTVYADGAAYGLPFSVRLEDFRLDYYTEPLGRITVATEGAAWTYPAEAGAELTIPGGLGVIKVLRLARDFGLTEKNEVIEKSPYWHNPAVQLEIRASGKKRKLWFFGNFPGMHSQELPFRVFYALEQAEVKNYTSVVTVIPASGPEIRAEISVNKPFRIEGYTLYQTSYDPADAGYSLLTATRDGAVWIVYAGFVLLLLGVLLWLRK